MKTIIILSVFFVFFSCNNKDKNSEKSLPDNTNVKNIVVKSEYKEKLNEALDLLKKYAKESKRFDQSLAFDILKIQKLVFGEATDTPNGAKGEVRLEIETDCVVQENDLPVFVDYTIKKTGKDTADRSAITIFDPSPDSSYYLSFICIKKAAIENLSVNILASILLHELVHRKIGSQNGIGSKFWENPRAEYMAYTIQINFIIYSYEGVGKEIEWVNGNRSVNLNLSKLDRNEFDFYLAQQKLYSELIKASP